MRKHLDEALHQGARVVLILGRQRQPLRHHAARRQAGGGQTVEIGRIEIGDARCRGRGRLERDEIVSIRVLQQLAASIREADIEAVENNLGLTWPWPRELYAYITQYCKTAGAKVLVYDWLFQDRGTYGVNDAETFAQAMRDSGNVVIGLAFTRPELGARSVEGAWAAELPVTFPERTDAIKAGTKLLGWNTRVQWIVRPGEELNLVYNGTVERVYINGWKALPVGKARYGLMLREDGFVMDDGTTARLGENHFLMTTTTANAGKVMQHLEFCHQVLWPELDVRMVSVSDQWAQVAVAGPKSREVLQGVVDPEHDLSNAAFPYLAARAVTARSDAALRFASERSRPRKSLWSRTVPASAARGPIRLSSSRSPG